VDRLTTVRWLWQFHAWARPRILSAAFALTPEELRTPGSVVGGLGVWFTS